MTPLREAASEAKTRVAETKGGQEMPKARTEQMEQVIPKNRSANGTSASVGRAAWTMRRNSRAWAGRTRPDTAVPRNLLSALKA